MCQRNILCLCGTISLICWYRKYRYWRHNILFTTRTYAFIHWSRVAHEHGSIFVWKNRILFFFYPHLVWIYVYESGLLSLGPWPFFSFSSAFQTCLYSSYVFLLFSCIDFRWKQQTRQLLQILIICHLRTFCSKFLFIHIFSRIAEILEMKCDF